MSVAELSYGGLSPVTGPEGIAVGVDAAPANPVLAPAAEDPPPFEAANEVRTTRLDKFYMRMIRTETSKCCCLPGGCCCQNQETEELFGALALP